MVCAAAVAGVLMACNSTSAPTPERARAFLDDVNATMLKLGVEQQQAGWVYSTFITEDTEALNARANQAFIDAVAKFAKEAATFDNVDRDARRAPPAQSAQALAGTGDAGRSEGRRRGHDARVIGSKPPTAAASGARTRRIPQPASTSKRSRRSWPSRATRKRFARPGKAGTRSRSRCARTSRDSWSSRTPARTNWVSATRA